MINSFKISKCYLIFVFNFLFSKFTIKLSSNQRYKIPLYYQTVFENITESINVFKVLVTLVGLDITCCKSKVSKSDVNFTLFALIISSGFQKSYKQILHANMLFLDIFILLYFHFVIQFCEIGFNS